MDAQLTPALERVTASVMEAHRRRQQVEEELASATAAVASLQQQSASFESSVLDLRKQLEATLEAKAKEEQALEQVSAKRAETLLQIDELTDNIKSVRGETEQAERSLETRIKSVRSAVGAIEEEVRGVKSQFGKVGSETEALRETIGRIRQSTEAALKQLTEVDSKAKDLNAATDSVAARLVTITAAVDQLQKDKLQIGVAADELQSLSAKLSAHKTQAETAVTVVEKLTKERERTASTIAEQLQKIDELCAASPAAASPGAASPVSASPASTSPAPPNGASSPEPANNFQTSQPNGSPSATPSNAVSYAGTQALLELLSVQGLLASGEGASGAQLLKDGGVDKLVRAWWSRAMASPAPGYYRLVLGQALAESGDSKGALTFFNRAMEGKQTDPFITYLVARALLDMKRYVDVLRIAQGLGRIKLGKALAANIEALHLAGSRRYDEAETKLAQALAIPGLAKVQYSETLYNLARLAESKGDVRAAAAWYERLYSVDPTYRGVSNHIERREAPAGVP
jgi:tetratricopeptide (TPR) repeat protein